MASREARVFPGILLAGYVALFIWGAINPYDRTTWWVENIPIVAVVFVFAPSGIGVREASMYGLLLAVTTKGVALGVTVLNRLTITIVEGLLLLVGALLLRFRARPALEPES